MLALSSSALSAMTFASSVAAPQIGARGFYDYPDSEATVMKWIALLGIGVAWIFGFVVMRYMKGRQEVQKARYEALAKLAEKGALGTEEAQRLMPESSRQGRSPFLWRFAITVAWLTLLGGILCFIISGFERGRDAEELAMAGVIACFVATAVFATPIMFREMRKQGILG